MCNYLLACCHFLCILHKQCLKICLCVTILLDCVKQQNAVYYPWEKMLFSQRIYKLLSRTGNMQKQQFQILPILTVFPVLEEFAKNSGFSIPDSDSL